MEVVRTRQSNQFFIELAKKLSPYSGRKVEASIMMKCLQQAAFQASCPQFNCGQKDSSDAVNGFVNKVRKDLTDLCLTHALTIGDGRGKGYSVSVNVDAVIKALNGIDAESYLTELRKPGPKKSKQTTKKPTIIKLNGPDTRPVDIPVSVPEVKITPVGKIDLDKVPKGKGEASKEREAQRKAQLQQQKKQPTPQASTPVQSSVQRTRTMADIRRIYGLVGLTMLWGGEIPLSALYMMSYYNSFYLYPNLKGQAPEIGRKNLRVLIEKTMDDFLTINRNEMNHLIVKPKNETSWSRIKSLYRGRVMTAQFAVRNDIGYTWSEEDFLKPYVKEVIAVNGKPAVITLSWDMTIESLQGLVLNCGDALDGAELINYRVNQQEIIVDKARRDHVLSWIYEIDNFTRENGLIANAVEVNSKLEIDIVKMLKTSAAATDNYAINNLLFYMMEKI